jgi:outer membrane protein assembly factor BamB
MGVQGLISYLNSSAVTTGTPPYTYQWFSEAPGASYYSSIGGANSSSYWFMTSTSTATGSWGFILQVKDSTGATVNSTAATVLVNSAGARSISLSTPAINGLRVDFNGAASPGNRVTYIQWIWGDGSADNGWFPHSHTYASSGDYFITVTAYFNDGTSASTSTAVNVYVGELTGGDRLTITAGNGGSVAYAASVGSGTIMPGGSKTLYLAHADDLSLAADPSSGYHFNSWTASAGISLTPNSTSSNIFIVVVSDASILANFGANIDWWPMFHHDLNHTGYSTSTPPKTNKTLWTYTTDGGVYSSPAVAGGYVYVGSDRVYCLNATTGASVWNYTTGGGVNSSPAVVGGYVYVGSSDSKVYCLNATMGTLKWSYTTGGAVQSSPAVVGGYVYVGSDDHNVYCLNAKTGAYVWNYTTGWVVSSSPAVAGGVVYVGSGEWDHHVYALNATTGVQVWNYTTGYGVDSSPAVAGGYVYVGSDDDKVYCLNAKTGASVWNYTTGSFVMTSPAVAGGYVYVGSDDDKVYCLNATMGTLKWSYKTGYGVWSSPAVADGYVYVGSNDFKVYCLNAATGASVWNYTTGSSVWSCPAVANGVVYVGSEDDNVYAFGALAPVATPYLLLTAEPIQATYSGGQTVAFTVDVLNQLCPALASTLTLTVTGPNGYYYYDFQAVNVTANSVGEYGFTWTAPYVTGTYVVEVSLVPVQLTAYDAVWLNVGTS